MKPLKFTWICRGKKTVKLEVRQTQYKFPEPYQDLILEVWEGREQYGKSIKIDPIEALALSECLRRWALEQIAPPEQVTDCQELKQAHRELLDRAHVYGIWGPFADGWEGSYDQRHWGEE